MRNSTYIILVFALLLVGCPKAPQQNGQPPVGQNLLPIPPLGTEFEYVSNPLEWDLQPHPRIMSRPESNDNFDSELRQEIMEVADMELEVAQTGGQPDPAAIVAWSLAFLLTDDAKYLDAVKMSLPQLTQFQKLVRYPEGANISFLQQAYILGAVYDLLYDKFSDEDRTMIETALRDTVFHTLAYKVTEYDTDINFWAMDEDTNYYVTFHSTAGMVAILLMDIVPEAKSLAEHSAERLYRSMDAFDAENGWREGLTYLDFCWGQSACYFLLALERNTSLEPYEHPWFEDSIKWAQWGSLPDGQQIACFGDNEPENYSVGSYMERVNALTDFSSYLSSDTYKYVHKLKSPPEMVSDIPFFKAAVYGRKGTVVGLDSPSSDFLESQYIEGLEWGFIMPEPWWQIIEPSDGDYPIEDLFYLALKSGVAGYDHNHLDQGSFILAAYSEVLISDPGRGGPDVIRRDPYVNCLYEAGLGHNTLIVGDGCYEDLELFPDNPKYFAEPGKITSYKDEEHFVQFTTNNSGLYPTEPLTDYRRSFIYLKPGEVDYAENGVLIIADNVAFSEPAEHSLLFHCPGTVDMVEAGRAVMMNNGARLDYTGASDIESIDRIERQESDIHERDSTCFFRTTFAPVESSQWIHVLVPARADEENISFAEISLGELSARIEINGTSVTLMNDDELGWIIYNY